LLIGIRLDSKEEKKSSLVDAYWYMLSCLHRYWHFPCKIGQVGYLGLSQGFIGLELCSRVCLLKCDIYSQFRLRDMEAHSIYVVNSTWQQIDE
jgi:hypothetical protein